MDVEWEISRIRSDSSALSSFLSLETALVEKHSIRALDENVGVDRLSARERISSSANSRYLNVRDAAGGEIGR